MSHTFEEIHVYNGVAERTGNQVERSGLRTRAGVCRSLTELAAKSRRLGDGYYYIVSGAWPADTVSFNVTREWQPLG